MDPKTKTIVPISALQHFSYCPRQCALIYLEDIYEENVYTLQGNSVHERVHEEAMRKRQDIEYETALPIWSNELGIRGKADLVEFHKETIVPIEYKRGKKKSRQADEIQLCAQALCLEEMFDTGIDYGEIYHHISHTRRKVEFSKKIKTQVREIIPEVRQLLILIDGEIPPPVTDARCKRCSLNTSCMPIAVNNKHELEINQRLLYEL